MKLNFTVISIVLFQAIWMLCVLAGKPWFVLGIGLLIVHFSLTPSAKADAAAMLVIASVGISFDFLLLLLGFYSFYEGHFPLWLALLWCAFGATFYHCFGWLTKQGITMQAVLGGIGGPLSYFTGMKVNAVSFPEPLPITLGVLAVFWALFFVLACGFKRSRFSYAHPHTL